MLRRVNQYYLRLKIFDFRIQKSTIVNQQSKILMNIQQLYEFCLSKKAATEHFPFDEDTLVFKVGGKMFCLTSLKDWESGNPSVLVKCDPDYALELRAKHEDVHPGYHSNKKYWNSVFINKELQDKKIVHFINHSYELVVSGLPKKLRDEIRNSQE